MIQLPVSYFNGQTSQPKQARFERHNYYRLRFLHKMKYLVAEESLI